VSGGGLPIPDLPPGGLLVVADLHLDSGRLEPTGPAGVNPAWLVAHRAWLAACEIALEHRAAGVVLAGDIFHTGRPLPEATQMLLDGLGRLARGRIPVLLVGGNHELIRWPRGHRHVLQQFEHLPGVQVALHQPRVLQLGDQTLAVVPWPHRGEMELPPEQSVGDRMVGQWLTQRVQQLAHHAPPGTPLVGHAVLGGVRLAEYEDGVVTQFASSPLGQLALPCAALGDHWSPAVFGHIHQRQAVAPGVHYVGAPWSIDFEPRPLPKGAMWVCPGHPDPLFVPLPDRQLAQLTLQSPCDSRLLAELEPGTLVRLHLPPDADWAVWQPPVVQAAEQAGVRILDWRRATPERDLEDPDRLELPTIPTQPLLQQLREWCAARGLDPEATERVLQLAPTFLQQAGEG